MTKLKLHEDFRYVCVSKYETFLHQLLVNSNLVGKRKKGISKESVYAAVFLAMGKVDIVTRIESSDSMSKL